MLIYPKLEYVFCTFKFQLKDIIKNADSDHAYDWIENEVVNFIEGHLFPWVLGRTTITSALIKTLNGL
jgi:hypothetical protein